MKSKYSTTLCLLCGAYIAKGAEIRKVGGAWVHDRCPRRDYTTVISAPAKAGPKESDTKSEANSNNQQATPQYVSRETEATEGGPVAAPASDRRLVSAGSLGSSGSGPRSEGKPLKGKGK